MQRKLSAQAEERTRIEEEKLKLEQEVERLKKKVNTLIDAQRARGIATSAEDFVPDAVSFGDALTKKKLLALIALCHPDKHANSERASEITKWLLELRK